MKNTYIYLVVLIIVVLFIFCLFKSKKKTVKISELKNMHFGYSTSTMMNAYVSYDLKYENDQYIATIKPNLVAEEDALVVEITEKDVKMIEEIFKNYEVSNWDGFNKSDKNVLDGNDFSLSVGFVNGDSISASGYMMYPKNYADVRNRLDEIFMNIYRNQK